MKEMLAMLALLVTVSEAHAIRRYTSTSMTCAEVQATIRADGAAIMRYTSRRTPGLPLYGRYVRDGAFCTMGESAERAYIPASDTQSCPVRECKQIDYDDRFIIIRPGRD